MSNPTVALVVPTLSGREAYLERCLASHEAEGVEIIVVTDEPSCGAGWLAGIPRALELSPSYVCLGSDDFEAESGWATAAIHCLRGGYWPMPALVELDGSRRPDCNNPARGFSAIPFLPLSLMLAIHEHMTPLHYFADIQIAHLLRGLNRRLGFPYHGWQLCEGFRFVHYWAPEGRRDSLERDEHEFALWVEKYDAARELERAGAMRGRDE